MNPNRAPLGLTFGQYFLAVAVAGCVVGGARVDGVDRVRRLLPVSQKLYSEVRMSEWSPMSSAPRDGTRILVWLPKDEGYEVQIAFWTSQHPGWVANRYWCAEDAPKAWARLPAPPPPDLVEE